MFVNEGQSVFCIYALIIILFHLQMMYILYFTTALSVTVSTIQYSNAYHSIQYYYTMALILHVIIIMFIIIRMNLLTNVITMLMIPMQQALSPFQLPCSEYMLMRN